MAESDYTFPAGPTSTSGVDVDDIQRFLVNHRQLYGEISYMSIGGKDIVCLNTVDAMREVLWGELMVDRPGSFSQEKMLMEDVTVQSYSEDWERLHTVMIAGVQAMTQPSGEMTDAQNIEFMSLKSRLRGMVGEAFDPREVLQTSLTSGMLIALTGQRYEYDHDIYDCYRRFELHGISIYGNLKANYILARLPCLRYLPFGYGRSFKLALKAKADIAKHLFHDIKHEADIENEAGMIYTMLRAQRADPQLTDTQIIAVIIDMKISGILALSAAMFSLIYHLLCYPDVQKMMYEEIMSVTGKDKTVSAGDLERLPYSHAVMLEVLRMCPVFTAAVRACNSGPATVRGYRFPPKTIYINNIFGVNHDKELWSEPWKFNPHRFLTDSGELIGPDHPTRQNLILFGEGKRGCAGSELAPSTLLLSLVNIIQTFEVYNDDLESPPDPDPMKYNRVVLLYPPEYRIKLRER